MTFSLMHGKIGGSNFPHFNRRKLTVKYRISPRAIICYCYYMLCYYMYCKLSEDRVSDQFISYGFMFHVFYCNRRS